MTSSGDPIGTALEKWETLGGCLIHSRCGGGVLANRTSIQGSSRIHLVPTLIGLPPMGNNRKKHIASYGLSGLFARSSLLTIYTLLTSTSCFPSEANHMAVLYPYILFSEPVKPVFLLLLFHSSPPWWISYSVAHTFLAQYQ